MHATFGWWWVMHKGALVASLGLSRDLLHFAIGGIAYVLLHGMMRSHAGAWVALLAIELANEAADAMAAVTLHGAIDWADSASDIALTLLVPTILWTGAVALSVCFPLARRRPPASRRRRAGRRRSSRATALPA